MPSLTLSKEYDSEYIVAQNAYNWIFPEEMQHAEPARDWYTFDTALPSVSEVQLEMFSGQTFFDDSLVFRFFRDQWRIERGTTSSTTEMVLCPSYQSIIGMGPKVIPLILAQLVLEGDDPDHWFWALQALTRTNPVSEEDEGNLRRMSKVWLEWAASEGYAR
jgi:hypothetical protein